jgi:serine protease inhibitor
MFDKIKQFSILSVLSMLLPGSAGKTREQILQVIADSKNLDVKHGFKEMIKALKRKDNITLSTSNGLFINEKYKVLESFKETFTDSLEGEVHSISRSNGYSFINDWASEKTGGKITDLFPTETMQEQVNFILINAFYFKADWAKKVAILNVVVNSMMSVSIAIFAFFHKMN